MALYKFYYCIVLCWACRWIYRKVCDAWPVRQHTCGSLPGIGAPLPLH